MDAPRSPHQEMVRQENRFVLGTFNPRTIQCASYSISRARALRIPEKEEAVLDFLMMTAGLDGRAREDLRDAVAGRPPPVVGIQQNPPASSRGQGAAF